MNNNKNIRIIQTFWGGGHNPLECGYGWSHAEHNLMSWALSCHSLRGHYSQVELYTDQRGYDVLIGKLAFAREKMSSANWPEIVNHFRESWKGKSVKPAYVNPYNAEVPFYWREMFEAFGLLY